MFVTKCPNHVNLVVNNTGMAWFFNERDGPYIPTLRTLHNSLICYLKYKLIE